LAQGAGRQGKEVLRAMSNPEAMKKLADRILNDADFRERMRQDPEGTIQSAGLELDEDDHQALRSVDWSVTGEELRTRASKAINY
jgi:hypothetical protein